MSVYPFDEEIELRDLLAGCILIATYEKNIVRDMFPFVARLAYERADIMIKEKEMPKKKKKKKKRR